jgi:hypothetical protein
VGGGGGGGGGGWGGGSRPRAPPPPPRIGTRLRDSGGARIPGYLMCHTAVWRS